MSYPLTEGSKSHWANSLSKLFKTFEIEIKDFGVLNKKVFVTGRLQKFYDKSLYSNREIMGRIGRNLRNYKFSKCIVIPKCFSLTDVNPLHQPTLLPTSSV